MKKVIGISGSILIDKGAVFPGYKRAYVNNDYIQAVLLGGGVPLIIPVSIDEDVIEAQLKNIDGIILSGGEDVNPLLFGEEPSKFIGETMDERDKFDLLLIKHAVKMKKPILGICRGCQILNVAFGGDLYQDCSLAKNYHINHIQKCATSQGSHTVDIEKDSYLYSIFGESEIVNSYHHMAIKNLAEGFKVIAISKDGIVEGIEKNEGLFILGVQWHPEMMAATNEKMLDIFKLLISKC